MTVPISAPIIKPGYKTTEFMTVLGPLVLTTLTLIFHRDFSGYVQAAGIAVSGIAAAAYAISRAHLKRPVDAATALYDLAALLQVLKDFEDAIVATKPTTAPATGSSVISVPVPPVSSAPFVVA